MIEIYATPSEPNRLDGAEQKRHGDALCPGEGREAQRRRRSRQAPREGDPGRRRRRRRARRALRVGRGATPRAAALRRGSSSRSRSCRFDAGTDPKARNVIATLDDRLTRFLTAGDLDGDGKKEIVAAGFKSGLWLLRARRGPEGPVERPADRQGLVGLRARGAAHRSRWRRHRRALRRERRPGRSAPLRVEGRSLRKRGDSHPHACWFGLHLEPDAGSRRAGPIARPYLSSAPDIKRTGRSTEPLTRVRLGRLRGRAGS